MAVCVVTGGAGFVGSHLAGALARRGDSVRILDNFSSGSPGNLFHLGDQVELVPGDITCYDAVRDTIRGADYVFHYAALGQGTATRIDPIEVHRTCATGTLHVLEAAREAQCKRVIYASTAYVYGCPSGSPVHEDDSTQPQSAYASSKLAGELHCMAFTRAYGLSTVRLRYFNLFGPGQSHQSIYSRDLYELLTAMLAGRRPVIHGDGRDCHEMLFIDDAIHATLLAAETDRLAARVYNVARGRITTALELIDAVNRLLGTKLRPKHVSGRAESRLNFLADISRAESELGYCPTTELTDALQNSIDHYIGRCDKNTPVAWPVG
jgi:UDP-glucose 4-epimerase